MTYSRRSVKTFLTMLLPAFLALTGAAWVDSDRDCRSTAATSARYLATSA